MPEPLHLRDPALRAVALAVVLVSLLLGVLLHLAWQHWFAGLAQLPADQARRQLSIAFGGAIVAACVLIAALGAYLWRGASRVRRAQRWPPPGARTLHDTPVLTGAAARRRARGMQAVALALWLVALALPVLAWRLHAALAPAAA